MGVKTVVTTIAMSVGLIACLVAIQFFTLLVWGLSYDGCTKYVPLEAIKSLERDVWMIWGLSFLANSVVLVVFLSRFLTRPRYLVTKPVVATLLSLVVWKALAIAGDVYGASTCGEARDFEYPAKLDWAGSEAVTWMMLVAWVAMAQLAIASVVLQKRPQIERTS